MPLGETILEFQLKSTSVKPIDLGGGQTRVEITYAGQVTGDVPGQHYGTLTFIAAGPIDRPVPWNWTGATLTTTGAIVRVSGQGQGVRTGQGHKARYRGTACYYSDDPKLAKFNNLIAAVEFETDPATELAKGSACVWK
jgi:hypothetical protein